jgi:hypothetical protein
MLNGLASWTIVFGDICDIPPDLQQGFGPVQFGMEHVHPDDRQPLLDERQMLHDGKLDRISAEYRYLHLALGQKWVHHLARIAGRGATGVHTFGVIRDITRYKRAEMKAHPRSGVPSRWTQSRLREPGVP